jgi:hypothetical protein
MADKIDVARLGELADEYADSKVPHLIEPDDISRWDQHRDEHFARLVMEECAKVCAAMTVFQKSAQGDYDRTTPLDCAIAIREQMP